MYLTRRFLLLSGATSIAAPALISKSASAAAGSTLANGGRLNTNEFLQSTNGVYRAIMQGDGNLVVYKSGSAIWASNTGNMGPSWLSVQTDGNIVLYKNSGGATWDTKTVWCPAPRLIMQNDGNLVSYDSTGRAIWASRDGFLADRMGVGQRLNTDQQLTSKGGWYRLIMQGDGNLVIYKRFGGPIWDSKTAGKGASNLIVQADGNVVIYRNIGGATWATNTVGASNVTFNMQTDGNLVAYSNGRPVWASGSTQGGSQAIDAFKSWALNPANWNGFTDTGQRGIDTDNYPAGHTAQCADIARAWSQRIGRPSGWDGLDGAGASKPGWKYISGSMGSARPGDVITKVGGARHVVVVVGSESNGRIPVIQQNPGSPAISNYLTSTSGVIWRAV